MIDAPPRRTGDIPPAFYRDAVPPSPPDDPHRHGWWRHDGEDRPPSWRFWSALRHTYSYGLVLSVLLSVLFVAMKTIPDFGEDQTPAWISWLLFGLLLLYPAGAEFLASRRSKEKWGGAGVGAVTALVGFGLAMLTVSVIDHNAALLVATPAVTLGAVIVGAVCGAVGGWMAHPRTFAAHMAAVVRDNLAGRISHG
jgi:O-antigen/teichoic acid export membrane protein